MTAAELNTRFDIELDAVSSGAAPGFTNDEKSELLTKAQDELIQSFVQLKNYNSIYTVVEDAIDIADTSHSGQLFYHDLNTVIPDFRYFINAKAYITRTSPSSSSGYVDCELIESKDINKFLNGINNIAYFKYPKIVLQYKMDNYPQLILILDNYSTLSSLDIKYIRTPANIDIDGSITSELPEFLHKDVVSLAVKEAVKSMYISKVPQQGQ